MEKKDKKTRDNQLVDIAELEMKLKSIICDLEKSQSELYMVLREISKIQLI